MLTVVPARTPGPRRSPRIPLLISVLLALVGACAGDDTTPTGSSPTSAASDASGSVVESTTTPSTTERPEPTYMFAVQPDSTHLRPSERVDPDLASVFPGQTVRLEFIQTDPLGAPCSEGPDVAVLDGAGATVATSADDTVVMPDVLDSPVTVVVHCERLGEVGVGTWGPLEVLRLAEVVISPAQPTPGSTLRAEARGCDRPETAVVDLVFPDGATTGRTAVLGADAVAELTAPDTSSQLLYARVECDGPDWAFGFTPLTVLAADEPDGAVRLSRSPGAMSGGALALPGELLAEEPIELAGLRGDGRRVRYGSTTPRGEVVQLTGVVILPIGGPRPDAPVAVWGHPTTGIGSRCAPSLETPFTLEGAQRLLDAGFVVAAPDYDGLGTQGTHPYLVGESEGRSMLDIARAAGTLGAGGTAVTWGWSQGGHASLWSRSIAEDYAPDLDLRATAAASPPTDLAAFLGPGFDGGPGFVATALTALSWAVVYENTGFTTLATPDALAAAAVQLTACSTDLAAEIAGVEPEAVWARGPDDVPAWAELTAANSVDPARGSGPVFLSHGGADGLVPIDGSIELAAMLCEAGETVVARFDDDWTHTGAYVETRAEMVDWLIAAGNGETPTSEC